MDAELIEFVKTFGVPTALAIYLVLQMLGREQRMEKMHTELNSFIRLELMGALSANTAELRRVDIHLRGDGKLEDDDKPRR